MPLLALELLEGQFMDGFMCKVNKLPKMETQSSLKF